MTSSPARENGIVVAAEAGILRLTIDRPDRKGAIDPPAVRTMVEALEAAATDDALRAVLVTSTGADFCSGADWVASNIGRTKGGTEVDGRASEATNAGAVSASGEATSGNPADGDGATGDDHRRGGESAVGGARDGAGGTSSDTAPRKPRPGSLQRRTALQAHRLIATLMEVQLPVVCAVRGWAAGLGCQIALASDFVGAADDARFWLPFTRRGFTPDSGATWLLPRLVGVARAKEMLLLGRPVGAADAAAWGMIHRAVPADDLDGATAELLDELGHAATVSVGLTKRMVNAGLDGGIVEAMEHEALGLEISARTADFREGLAAFREKRDPDFTGR